MLSGDRHVVLVTEGTLGQHRLGGTDGWRALSLSWMSHHGSTHCHVGAVLMKRHWLRIRAAEVLHGVSHHRVPGRLVTEHSTHNDLLI